jgi:hypothetical protein
MTETRADTTTSPNGTTPAPPPDTPCEDCATSGEKALAILGALFGIFLIIMAFDMFTGGKIGGFVKERAGD